MLRGLSAVILAVCLVLIPAPMLMAEGTTVYDLRAASFALPSDWEFTNSRRDQEYGFASPDGRFDLWARWWFPDEPLLGYDDIVLHERRQMAGQEALFIHRDSGGLRSLEVAFLTPDARDEVFLWQLHSATASLAEHEAMFARLLMGLRLNGQPAMLQPAPEPDPPPARAPGADPAPDPARASEAAPVAAAPLPGLILDGRSIAGLLPLAFGGVTFEQSAHLGGGALSLGVAEGQGWARLGLATPVAVLTMPARDAKAAQRITAVIDASHSSGIAFALVAPADAAGDPDQVSDLTLRFSTPGDGTGALVLTTRDAKQAATASFPWPRDQAVFNLLLRPDQTLEVRDGTGAELADMALKDGFAGREWALQTYLQPHQKNGAAALVLQRLSVDTVPYQPAPTLDPIATGPQSAVIFDGYGLGRLWEPVSRSKSQIASFLRLSDGALRIGWTARDKGAWTGISTPEAVLWLDRFTGDAEARVDLALDGAATKDFEIALHGPYTLPGNLSGARSYVLGFTQDADGTFTALSALRSQEKDGLMASGLEAIPDRITLVLTPEGVRVEGKGLPEGILPFAQLQTGAGLRIAIHAKNTAANDAALVLRGVRVALHPDEASPDPAPQPGVAPLPQSVFPHILQVSR